MNLGLESAEIIDQYHRTFSSLRISLTGICNLGCTYCVPEKLTKSSIRTEVSPLPYHTLFDIVCQLGSILKFKNIRLTGGEPTLYPDLIPFTRLLKSQHISTISLTTNGYLLKPLVKDLKDAGVSAINISLDTLQESTFSTLARSKSLYKILEAIEETIQLGIPVKINMVVMKGINSNEVLEMLNYCGERGITLRYLELMKMGHLYSNGKFNDLYYSESEILNLIGKEFSFIKEER
ncbi:MAG: radical SAM protein, partial [Cytophagales bacterium]|nr:radical SAM protein [Cytophagales bacterium]